MEHLKNTTELIGIKDKNIALDNVFQHKTHIELYARLDYEPKKQAAKTYYKPKTNETMINLSQS
nr:hypothetical protein [Streptococcus halichoeri]